MGRWGGTWSMRGKETVIRIYHVRKWELFSTKGVKTKKNLKSRERLVSNGKDELKNQYELLIFSPFYFSVLGLVNVI